jgi:hypothetical protein
MNVSNEIGTIKVQKINSGYYIRVPAAAVRIIKLKKGEFLKVHISTDKQTIRFSREPDTIIIPEPRPVPVPHIQGPSPALEHEPELLLWFRQIFTKK